MRITRRNKRNALKKQKTYKRKILKSKRSTKRQMKKMMRGGAILRGNNVLLIIDPQIDFVDDSTYNPALPVPKSKNDMEKIAKFITDNINTIDEIHVSLDSHTKTHIAHSDFWINTYNKPLQFCTLFVKDNDTKIYIKDTNGTELGMINPQNPLLNELAYKYIKAMNDLIKKTDDENIIISNDNTTNGTNNPLKPNKPPPLIWPTHCLKTENQNWNVHPILHDVLKQENIYKKVTYHEKGTNDLVEMYSIFSAEVPFEEIIKDLDENLIKDIKRHPNSNFEKYPWYNVEKAPDGIKMKSPNETQTPQNPINNYCTTFNDELFKKLMINEKNGKKNKVFVCGEAKTHCVKTSLEDMVQHCDNNNYLASNIYLLDDMASSIKGQPPNENMFIDNLNNSLLDLKQKGMNVINSEDYINATLGNYISKTINTVKQRINNYDFSKLFSKAYGTINSNLSNNNI
jgi:nicotinamidase-related amidase